MLTLNKDVAFIIFNDVMFETTELNLGCRNKRSFTVEWVYSAGAVGSGVCVYIECNIFSRLSEGRLWEYLIRDAHRQPRYQM